MLDKNTIGRALKNKLRPHMNDYWCIPSKGDADFVACMEDVLDVHELPYAPCCLYGQEKPYQLLDDVREPLPVRLGDNQKTDSKYKRNGICSIFAFVEPSAGIPCQSP